MPGLSQLKKFKSDLLSLGDEVTVRASRGEKPVDVIIPKEVEDKDDSEDFVLGMPEIEAAVADTQVDDDLSDLTGIVQNTTKTSDSQEEAAPAFAAPDLSSLLTPMADDSAGDIPDLSMFDNPEPEEEEIVEEEPEEISIADMGLDALLAGGGFDEGSEQEEEPEEETQIEEEPEPQPEEIEDLPPEDFGIEDTRPFDSIPSTYEKKNPNENGLSLDDLLGETSKDTNPVEDIESLDEPEELTDSGDLSAAGDSDGLGDLDLPGDSGDFNIPEEPASAEPVEDLGAADDFSLPDDISTPDLSGASDALGDLGDLGDIGEPGNIGDIDETAGSGENAASGEFSEPEAFTEPAAASSTEPGEAETFDLPDDSDSSAELEPLEDLNEIPSDDNKTAEPKPAENAQNVDFSFDSFEVPGFIDVDNQEENKDASLPGEELEAPVEDFAEAEPVDIGSSAEGTESAFDEIPEAVPESLEEPAPADAASLEMPDNGLESFDSFDLPDLDDANLAPAETENSGEEPAADDFAAEPQASDDFAMEPVAEDFGSGIEATEDNVSDSVSEDFGTGIQPSEGQEEDGGVPDDLLAGMSFDLDNISGESPENSDFSAEPESETAPESESADSSFDFDADNSSDSDFGSMDFSADDSIPDYADDISDNESEATDEENTDDSATLEVFDTSEMEGLDFGIKDTDSQLGGSPDFELGGSDDFAMEGEFEIPGFSDVDTIKEEKKAPKVIAPKGSKNQKNKNLPEPDFSEAQESEDLPPNTLSDAQYKKFLKNLSEYPLNVRLAFEDLIVQDEFTDDAEFEIIEKILHKAPARQIASMLEKMLDISIPVPRDFEHRTAEEYEAYKKSLSYQLRNKIIPGMLVAALLLIVGWGLFNFTRSCIYRPLVANKYYKQGYTLLEADEYPQSEMSFNKAVSYRINKKWFFKYARGYREHKQYQRASGIYQKILTYFKHDKIAGLEYADMELEDLANYERAEEIVRREILDYHVNDPDGILKLGDVFLEWGTEKDPSKLELAREQYATLIQLYKPNDLYLSRMMRYFIRSDNLREVLQVQQTFTKEKQLSSDDWTELSGYLLEKYYGSLPPSQEYLRYEIEGLRGLLTRAVKTNPDNPIALYNLSKYYVKTNENEFIENTLQRSIEKFNSVESIKKRDLYKYIDAYKLLGEYYVSSTDYLKAQEQFAEGISLYTTERDYAGFEGTPEIGKLYEDMGNIKYSISGDLEQALSNYTQSVALENDSPSIRYRIGYIQYKNKNYLEALGSFMKAGDGNVKERNLLLAMANTLSLRKDDYAAQGYYNQLIDNLNIQIADNGIVFPQANINDYDIVNTYLHAANNYGVTLYRLAKRTGNSSLNAQAIVQFSQSVRAWDALTRNQETMTRLGGSNLAEQNIKYITNPIPDFEPSIYIDISKTLTDNEKL